MSGAPREVDTYVIDLLADPEQLERFQSLISEPTEDGCRLWLGTRFNRRYGRFMPPRSSRYYSGFQAHRVSLLLTVGLPPSADLEAAHSCRNKHCVAPDHLRWATPLENAADRHRDGTQTRTRGASHPNARLTSDQVEEIRAAYLAGGVSQRDLSRRYSLAQSAISNIVNGKHWTFRAASEVGAT